MMIDPTAAIKIHRFMNYSHEKLKLSPDFDRIMLMMLENSNFANEKSKVMKIHIVKNVARKDEKAEKKSGNNEKKCFRIIHAGKKMKNVT